MSKAGNKVRTLAAGDTFGEAALLEYNNVRQMSIKAVEEVKEYRILSLIGSRSTVLL